MEEFGLPGIWGLTPIAGMLGMIAMVYWLLVSGRLITKSSHEREIGIYKTQQEYDRKTIQTQAAQITSLMAVGKTVQAVLQYAGTDVEDATEPIGGPS